jgi:ubiquinone biosynthesis protein
MPCDLVELIVDWGGLIDEQALAALLPGEYARFAAPVKEGLVVFLNGLPHVRQCEIFARQWVLGLDAPLARRLGELARSSPVLHKLGQILARDRRLAVELRDQLRPLECLPPSTPWGVLESALWNELGARLGSGIELTPPALAEASVAVVVPFRQLGEPPVHGVFKILKPGIGERLEQELQLLGEVGAHFDERCQELGIPPLDYQEAFGQVRAKLAWEVRLDEEQRHLAAAARLYADEPSLQIPRLFVDLSTPRVTAMERIVGVRVTDHCLDSSAARRRLARMVARGLIAKPLLASGADAAFHCDPHAGNLLQTDDGRLAILDWSLVARLSEREHVTLTQLLIAALLLDGAKIARLTKLLAHRDAIDDAALHAVVHRWLARRRSGQLPGLEWLVGLLDDASLEAGLRVSPEMMLFRKSLLTLKGVLADLTHNGFDADEVLLRDFLGQFASEWPLRWTAPLKSREFATRISNGDLLEMAWTWPFAAARAFASC